MFFNLVLKLCNAKFFMYLDVTYFKLALTIFLALNFTSFLLSHLTIKTKLLKHYFCIVSYFV